MMSKNMRMKTWNLHTVTLLQTCLFLWKETIQNPPICCGHHMSVSQVVTKI